MLSGFTNELFSWKTSVPIEVAEHLLKSCKAAPGQNRTILRSLLSAHQLRNVLVLASLRTEVDGKRVYSVGVVPGRQNVHFASDDGNANGFRRPPKNPDAGWLLDLATRIACKLNH